MLTNRIIRVMLLAALILPTLSIGQTGGSNGYSRHVGPVPGRFIVKLSVTAKSPALQASLGNSASLRRIAPITAESHIKDAEVFNRLYVLASRDSLLTVEDVERMLGAENVEAIEQDHYLQLFEFPTDSLFAYQWALYNTGQEYPGIVRRFGPANDTLVFKSGIAGWDIHLSPFYTSPPTESTKVVVAIVDTGVDMLHPELSGRIWRNTDEIPFNGIDDDHNGFVDDTVGYDLSGDVFDILNIVPDNDPTDQEGHGTHVAGIVASNADGVGIVGVAPMVEIMPVKTFPNATTSTGAAGIVYAVIAGAQVINISWGSDFQSFVVKDAMDLARRNGVFVSVAAGNTGTNRRSYPAAFDSSFTVGAGNSAGYMTSFSTYGPMIDVVAPGEDILSLRAAGTDLYAEDSEPNVHIIGPDSLYYLADGTSMAAPMVAGAAALIWSYRPDITLNRLEDVLRLGAVDLVDPRNMGDTLIGPDTISGYGYVDVGASFSLLDQGGLYIVTPERNIRYTSPVDIRIAPGGTYTGGYTLEYAVGLESDDWQLLASQTALPADSVAYTFDLPDINGHVKLRLTDDLGNATIVSFVYVTQDSFIITSPVDGQQFKYDMPVTGSVYGPNFDSVAVYYRNGGSEVRIAGETREIFDTIVYHWSISGLDPGGYELIVYGYFSTGLRDTVFNVDILSSFSAGWPKLLSGRGGLTPVCADLSGDGSKEIIVATMNGLNVFTSDGEVYPGFPVLPETDLRGVPAVYDIDNDGVGEIIVASAEGLHAYNGDGSVVDGWPKSVPLGILAYGTASPTVTLLGVTQDSAIIVPSANSDLYAYEFNGDSYFYSLEGYYGTFSETPADASFYSGNAVASSDLTGNGQYELAMVYSANSQFSGVGLFSGRNGRPAFDMPSPLIHSSPVVYGIILADLNDDGRMEIVINCTDESLMPTISVKTDGTDELPGWPVQIPAAQGWLASYPTVADLDLDGSPEILVAWFGLEIASLYAFRADGTPYAQREGRPAGEIFLAPTTLGVPMVANLTGDNHPEIVMRGGHIFPGTGPEMVYILDYTGTPLPGWPIETPTSPVTVFSTPYTPLVDDIDGDGLVELLLVGEGNDLYVWDFPASYENGANRARLFNDNANSSIYRPPGNLTAPTRGNEKSTTEGAGR